MLTDSAEGCHVQCLSDTKKRCGSQQLERTFFRKRPRTLSSGAQLERSTIESSDVADIPRHASVGDCLEVPRQQTAARNSHSESKRPLTQLHLDLGQANFACKTCKLCGMTYAPGEENDERVHAAYHASLVRGVAFAGWQTERVVRRDEPGGRILLILPTDCPAHLRKVKEISDLLEDQLGLVNGWLLSTPCKVYLYVAASKRVVGCAMIQAVSRAYRAMPADDAMTCVAESSACSKMPPTLPEAQSTAAPVEEPARRLDAGPLTAPHDDLQIPDAHCSTKEAGPSARENRSSDGGLSTSMEAEQSGQDFGVDLSGSLGCTGVRRESSVGAASAWTAPSTAGRTIAASRQGRGGGLQPQQREALLRVDESAAKEAACGVRVIWVSVEARLQGIATKLLDTARSTFVSGCIIPRQELAFSQPTEQGRRFATSYTGCSSFLVYK
ncbi:probable N-acetyltransferase ESCO1 [Coccomyxa sp. Obi]|nr:probable N-acetyltransferase ESCO1 [Coccomyxa sp. Obi]